MDLERLFKREFERLGGLVLPLVGDPREVEVMVGEAFARLWEKRDTVYRPEEVVDFLENAVLGQAIRFMVENRKKNADASAEDTPGDLQALIAQLPTHARATWVLAHESKLDFAQIGEMLDLSADTVAKQLGKALRLIFKGMTGQAQPEDLDLKGWTALCEEAGKVLAGQGSSELQAHPSTNDFREDHPQIAILSRFREWWQAGTAQQLTFHSDPDAQWKLFTDVVPNARGGKIVDYDAMRRRKRLRRKWTIRIVLGLVAGGVIFLLYLLIRWIV